MCKPRCPFCRWTLRFEAGGGIWIARCRNPDCDQHKTGIPIHPWEAAPMRRVRRRGDKDVETTGAPARETR